jgi:hypothetical protein
MRARGGERGFLLIGVIMFVLALTILGLSLYSLSNYEGDFQARSRDSRSALYRAQGGLELVQALLSMPPYRLSSAAGAETHQGIVFAQASQRRDSGINAGTVDSLGAIDWSDTVLVTVLATEGTGTQLLQAKYLPRPRDDYYKRLATVRDYFSVHGPLNSKRISLFGQIWDGGDPSADSTLIKSLATWTVPVGMAWMKRGQVPMPDLTSWFADPAHQVMGPVDTSGSDQNTLVLRLNNFSSQPVYYQHPYGNAAFHMIWRELRIYVRGTVVLVCPHGLYAYYRTSVVSGPGTLVIVAAKNGAPGQVPDPNDQNTGIFFSGGLSSDTDIPVILASDAQVKIEHINNFTQSSQVPHLSVLGTSLDCLGPTSGGGEGGGGEGGGGGSGLQSLSYDSGTMDSVIDALYLAHVLPVPEGVAPGFFTFMPGSWRDLAP